MLAYPPYAYWTDKTWTAGMSDPSPLAAFVYSPLFFSVQVSFPQPSPRWLISLKRNIKAPRSPNTASYTAV